MRPLELNFTWQLNRWPMRISSALLAVALIFLGWIGWLAYDALAAVEALTTERQTLLRLPETPRMSTLSPEEKERQRAELKMAQGIIERLDTPWGALFAAVESAFDEQATLLNVEPDPEHREVRLTGEAKHLAAMQTYIRQLRQVPGLRDAYLASHQVNQQDPLRPVRFAASARWFVPGPITAEETETDKPDADAPNGESKPGAKTSEMDPAPKGGL